MEEGLTAKEIHTQPFKLGQVMKQNKCFKNSTLLL